MLSGTFIQLGALFKIVCNRVPKHEDGRGQVHLDLSFSMSGRTMRSIFTAVRPYYSLLGTEGHPLVIAVSETLYSGSVSPK